MVKIDLIFISPDELNLFIYFNFFVLKVSFKKF